jgi:hypothetical protein
MSLVVLVFIWWHSRSTPHIGHSHALHAWQRRPPACSRVNSPMVCAALANCSQQGRVYYLNHTNKTTTWDDPRLTWVQPQASSAQGHASSGELDPREAAIAESAASAVALRERAGGLSGMDPKARQTEALYISEMANREQIKLDALQVSFCVWFFGL